MLFFLVIYQYLIVNFIIEDIIYFVYKDMGKLGWQVLGRFFFEGQILQCWKMLCKFLGEKSYYQFCLVMKFVNYNYKWYGKVCLWCNSRMKVTEVISYFLNEFKVCFIGGNVCLIL